MMYHSLSAAVVVHNRLKIRGRKFDLRRGRFFLMSKLFFVID